MPPKVLFVRHEVDDPPGLVGHRLIELGAQLEAADPRRTLPDPLDFDLVVPLGSVDSAADDSVPYLARERELLETAVRADVPVFGICFGAQLLCRVLGGSVTPASGGPEIDWMRLNADPDGLVEPGPWVVWHHDVMSLPKGAVEIARSPVGPHAFTFGPHVGVQFHPEATSEMVRSWARRYPEALRLLGHDPERLCRRIAADAERARLRAATLVDRVLEHARAARGALAKADRSS